MNDDIPKTLLDAVRYFSDLKICCAYMRRIKWPDGKVRCPKCGGESVSDVKDRPLLQCNTRACKKQFSYKVGTIFEDSPLGLDKWFVAVWCIANAKNGISSHELSRALGVTQKTAWFMLHRIREAMQTGSFRKLQGAVEVDETFVGGAAANMHKHLREKRIRGRGTVGKAVVQGILERGGEVRTLVVRDTEGETLRPPVYRNVEWGSTVFTDAHQSYLGLSRSFAHYMIDHATEFVRGVIHTNGIENFWSLLKRSLNGTWTHVAAFHLERYCREQAWRFNNRKTNDGVRFERVLAGVLGRRITYRQLCAIDDAGFMGKP
jgi:transposase-like protein